MEDLSPTLRLLITPGGEPAWNMALDEALLLLPDSPPTLRFYTWEPAGISLGYFQEAAQVLPLPPGVKLVRRITGGLAIYHYSELTWSITAPEGIFTGPIENSYRTLHAGLIEAIHGMGARGIKLREDETLDSEGRDDSPWCFERSSSLDLVWDKRKLAGSAQRRTDGRLLHHGSVPLEKNPLTPHNTWVSETAGRPVSFAELAQIFGQYLAKSLAMHLVPGEILPAEEEKAKQLIQEKHANPSFLHRRIRRHQRPDNCGINCQD